MAADDFKAIRNRMIYLQNLQPVELQSVELPHEFDLAGWCTRCKLHRFHTPAVPDCRAPE